ncbi:MAG: protein kinase [Marinicellaceae bacterium]
MSNDSSIQNWKDAKELFEQYLDQPKSQSLQKVHADDSISAPVKAILINLINSQSEEDTIIDHADLSFFSSLEDATEDLSGKSIDGYQLIERIGQGGMSNVYKAKRKGNDIQKFVALKLLTSVESQLSETLKLLFEREQMTLSKLNHPHIISFHHGGISNSNIPYLIMDYIENAKTINEYVEDNALDNHDIVVLVKKVADAINYAHQNLIIHKDIKPNNVLIDELGMPKVVDFGIASFDNFDTDKQLSAFIFTPDYASPEQIRNQDITANSDIFSLAALLLELLIKKKPLPEYQGKTINNSEYSNHLSQLLKAHNLPHDLHCIISKALEPEKGDRYQSMLGFVTDLDRFLNKKPITARNQSHFYVFSKYIQRNPGFSLAILAFIISAIIGINTTINQKNKAILEALKAQQVTDFLIDSIQVNDPDINQGKEVSVKELLLNAKINIQQTSLEDKVLSTALEQTIGNALAKIGQYQDAESLLKQAIATESNNFDANISLAQLYFKQHYYDKTSELLSFLSSNKKRLTQNQNILFKQLEADLLFHQGNFTKAEAVIKSIIDSPKISDKQLIDSQLLLARFINEQGDSQKSIEILYEALSLSHKVFTETSTSSTNILYQIANVYSDMSPLPEDKLHKVYQQTINNQRTIFGDNHPYLSKTYLRYGFALKIFGEYDSSRQYANKAMKIALSNFGENHMMTARVNILISQLNLLENNISQAIEQLEKVVEVHEQHYGVNHFETNQTKTTLAGYYLKSNMGEKALAMLMPLHESLVQQLGETNKAAIYAKMNILKAQNMNGNHTYSIQEGKKLLNLSKLNLGDEAILSVGVQMVLAESYFNENEFDHTVALCEELLTFSLVENNIRYKQKVTDLRDKALESKNA